MLTFFFSFSESGAGMLAAADSFYKAVLPLQEHIW